MQEIVAFCVMAGVICVVALVFAKIVERYSDKHFAKYKAPRSAPSKKMPRKREYCLTTKCPDCRMMFLETIPMYLDKLPSKCSGCGGGLTWNIPYTRLEIDCDDEDSCRYINVIHRLEWQELMMFHISDALKNVLDEGVKKVEIKIQK